MALGWSAVTFRRCVLFLEVEKNASTKKIILNMWNMGVPNLSETRKFFVENFFLHAKDPNG